MARADQLPCGTAVDELLRQVADHTPPVDPAHQHACPHCRATLAEIHTLWEPVTQLAADQPDAPAGLRAAVMTAVRALPRTAWHAVLPDDRGTTRIAARVFATVVRRAADGIPAVALAFGRGRLSVPVPSPGDASDATKVGVAGGSVVLDISVVVKHPASIPALTRQLRARVLRQVTDLVGVTPTQVNIDVVDIDVDL